MESIAQRQERQIATQLQRIFGRARPQPGSGNQATSPNDIIVPHELHVECKATEAKQMIVQYDWLIRAAQLARQFTVGAVIAIRFSKFSTVDYFIVEDTKFYSLLQSEHQNEVLIAENKRLAATNESHLAQINRDKEEMVRLEKRAGDLKRTDKAYQTPDAYEGQL